MALSAIIVSPIHAMFNWNGTWIALALFSVVMPVFIVLLIKPVTQYPQQKSSQTVASQKVPPTP
ncbi:hypothetical protein [Lysinibacillus xylanilyticus]|uniref:hypothetical protein n=1 Tax=Lysinibacillus xylanilyticus TaxID=582475 RepID=UPI002B242FEF|nr:hypothetical protein [Lysinibacillus xylanilyticus]